MELKKYTIAFVQSILYPRGLYTRISLGEKHHSWIIVLIYCLIYLVGSLWLYFNGFTPFIKPWIIIPPELYYFIQAFYIIPLIFLMWILGTGVVHVISKFFGGSGRFHTLLTITGYSLWAPWYPLIVVDSIRSIPEWLYNAVLFACILLVIASTSKAAIVEEKVKPIGAIISSIIALFSIGVILFTYIR
jgi:hypothetical protein